MVPDAVAPQLHMLRAVVAQLNAARSLIAVKDAEIVALKTELELAEIRHHQCKLTIAQLKLDVRAASTRGRQSTRTVVAAQSKCRVKSGTKRMRRGT
mmetsp:Transcript_39537/g.97960  ORF Transcript_39537/g.97960 Transcript_39537/m.97960 type:complete len:97 (+) Transcript_39537:22-312(+)